MPSAVVADEGFHAIVKKCLFEFGSSIARLARVGLDCESAGLEPLGDQSRVANRQRVDDAVSGQRGHLGRQPRQPLGLIRHPNGLQPERRPVQITPGYFERRPEHGLEIGHHPVVRRGGCGQETEVLGQGPGDAFQQAIVGPKVVTPIRNAMGLVDYQECDAFCGLGQDFRAKPFVRQALGRDEYDVHFVAMDGRFHVVPVVAIVGVDGDRTHAHALRRGDLVAHEGEQRGYQQGRPGTRFPQEFGGDEIDETLAPAGFLHHQQPAPALHDVADGFRLALAKAGVWNTGPQPEQVERSIWIKSQSSPPPDAD